MLVKRIGPEFKGTFKGTVYYVQQEYPKHYTLRGFGETKFSKTNFEILGAESKRDLALRDTYPHILKNLGGDPTKTGMSWAHGGISVGDGWIPLLEQLMGWLQFQHDKNGYPQVVADRIKEKFGTLSFYYHVSENTTDHKWKNERSADYLDGAISFAMNLSSYICERCGNPGELRRGGWLKTRCDDCNDRDI